MLLVLGDVSSSLSLALAAAAALPEPLAVICVPPGVPIAQPPPGPPCPPITLEPIVPRLVMENPRNRAERRARRLP